MTSSDPIERAPVHFVRTPLCVLFIAALGALTLAGCGQQAGDEPSTDHSIGTSGSNNGSNEADAGDGHKSGVDTDEADASRSDDLVGQNCVAPPESLGELAADEQLEVARSFHKQTGNSHASCAPAPPNSGVYWMEFSVAEAAVAHFEVEVSGSADAVVELRSQACPDEGATVYCDTASTHRTTLEKDNTYYLLVQGAADTVSGQFRLTIDLEPALCSPQARSCSQGSVSVCQDGLSEAAYACAGTCGDASSCSGDTCEAAKTVDLSAEGTASVVSGDQSAYASRWDADSKAGCNLYEGEPAGATRGPDLFFRLTGHEVGDQVLFDAEDGGTTFGFYILGGCNEDACLSAGAYDDQLDNRYTWQAGTDADVWVAAEVLGPPRDRAFRIEISRLSSSP